MTVDVIRDPEELERFAPSWDRLLEASDVEHPFVTHEWIRSWWECFGAGSELYVVRVRRGGRTIALAPMMLRSVRRFGVRLRALGFLYNVHTPRCDFILARGGEDACAEIWEHLASTPNWDVLELPQLSEGSATLAALAGLELPEGYRTGLWRSTTPPT
jgi:CelD/BcsL family acetyltransferase involved in cellulose biosynthesis